MTKNKSSILHWGMFCLLLTLLGPIQAFNIETKITNSATQIFSVSGGYFGETMVYDKDNNKMLVGSLSNGNVHSCDLSTGGCTEINFDNGNSKGLTSLTLSEGGEVTACYSLDETRCNTEEVLGQLGHCFKSADGSTSWSQLEEENCGTPGNVYIMFMVDGSSSVNSDEFTKIKQWIIDIISSDKVDLDRATLGVIQFAQETNTKVEIKFGDYTDIEQFKSKVSAIAQGAGKTYTAKGLELAADAFTNAGFTEDDLPWLLVLTDGISSQSETELETAVQKLKDLKINRATLGVGSDTNKAQLIDIASSTSDVYEIENFDALNKVQEALVVKLDPLGNEGSGSASQSTELRSLHKGFSAFFDKVS